MVINIVFILQVEHKRKYAKWKAVEIDRCLKNGITPTPGPPGSDQIFDDDDDEQSVTLQSNQVNPPNYGFNITVNYVIIITISALPFRESRLLILGHNPCFQGNKTPPLLNPYLYHGRIYRILILNHPRIPCLRPPPHPPQPHPLQLLRSCQEHKKIKYKNTANMS